MISYRMTLMAAAAATALAAGPAQSADSITVASWGGAYQDAQRKALFDPTAKELGVTINEATLSGLAEVRVQVRSGAVTWDVVDLGATECAIGAKEGLFEPLDYSVIEAEGIDKALVHDDWIGIIYYSTILAWNTDTVENPPKSWADFWDTEKFAGLRSLRGQPQVQLEIALMADGVPIDEVYPLDVERAFKKMEEIKGDITTWWTSGAQSAQLIKDGEVDMIGIWNGRLSAAMGDGAKAGYTYNQGALNADCLAIPKGAPNKELAQKAIAHFVSAKQQAMLPKYINYGPVNQKAFELDVLTEEEKKAINSSPENIKNQLVIDAEWWGENGAEILERWDAMIQQ
ncbi:ABC transporter substrate-binding protein [Kaustia mangrovi]|uniref:ABC transporter substrate-binding protein n=1 Tax=Kaustia mangrovi TaxID=2593653 RepID=A0A7S8HBM5_9HYPH|nr:ABC transporter substrate-binding protein [Kaustia mangrovi]QPC42629.1 ABC transporter substrate-binding protein [Kaustia mangrovi]